MKKIITIICICAVTPLSNAAPKRASLVKLIENGKTLKFKGEIVDAFFDKVNKKTYMIVNTFAHGKVKLLVKKPYRSTAKTIGRKGEFTVIRKSREIQFVSFKSK